MVGRDKELDRLELQIMKAVNGEGSVVNVIGEAGIGKSRLIAELKERDVIKRVTLLEGRAISIGKNLSFHPIIDLLKQWAGIAEDDSGTAAFDKLEKAIRAVHPEETNEILPFVATLMGMKLTGKHEERVKGIEGEGLEKLILKNVRDLVNKGSELRPTVIIMEDLHWADTSSIELLESLYRLAEKQRIAFVNVFRPGYFDSDDRAVAKVGERLPVYYVGIEIQPLDKDNSETLINNILEIKGLPYLLKTQIVERAGGNPFFIEEVVRSLIDEGAVVRKDGGFAVTEKIAGVVIPPTINDVLMARIDRLEERTRELVKVASVIGRSFFDRIIRDVADSIEDMDYRLAYLKDIQLIRDRTRMKELEYLFKHALAQEAAYESTLIQQRKALHLKVAQSIEKIFQERLYEFFGMLAYHYSKGEDLEKAEEYMTKAGEEALRSSASSEALNYFQEALRLYVEKYKDAADPEKLASFEKNMALAFWHKGQHANAVKYFDLVLSRWGAGSPENKLRKALRLILDSFAVLINLYLLTRRRTEVPTTKENLIFDLAYKRQTSLAYVDSKRLVTEQVSLLRRSAEFDTNRIETGARFWFSMGGIMAFSGISFTLAKRFLATDKDFQAKNDPGDIMAYMNSSTVVNSFSGSWTSIGPFADTAVDQALASGEFWDASSYIFFYGLAKAEQGQFEELRMAIQRLSEIAEFYQYGQAAIWANALTVELLIKKRKLHEAQAEAEKLISLTVQSGAKHPQVRFMGFKLMAQIMQEDVAGAEESIFRIESLIAGQAFPPPIFLSTYRWGRFLTDIHLLKEAPGPQHEAKVRDYRSNAYQSGKAALKNSRKFVPYRTKILCLMGTYYWLIGKQGKAMKWWDRAIKKGERLGARPDLSRTYFEVGKRLLEPESKYKELNGIEAKSYLKKAGILFEEMGLERDLDDLDKIASDS